MQYSTIYNVDCCRSVSIRRFAPPRVRKLWKMTEGDSQYEGYHLGADWENGKHRKWCALLTQEQFDEFISHTSLVARNVTTMGSIGSPGFGCSWSPTISFSAEHFDALADAYVTPVGTKAEIITFLQENEIDVPQTLLDSEGQQFLWPEVIDHDAVWNAVRKAVIKKYAD